MVTVGLTLGLALVDVNPLGLLTHEYESPDTAAAPIVALLPLHIVWLFPVFALRVVMTTFPELLQPVDETVTVR